VTEMTQTAIEGGLSITGQLPSNTVDVIREAAKSPLGILALIVILVATLAIRFFPPKKSSERVRAAIFSLIFAGVLLFGYSISTSLKTPDIFRVKVIVLNTEGMPTEDARVWSSLGGEGKRISGGWEFDIASSAVPADKALDIYASEESAFLTGHASLLLTTDHNPVARVVLQRKETTVQGRVIDEAGNGVADATVSVDGYPGESQETDSEGNFIINAHASMHAPVELHVEKKGFKPLSQQHFAGTDSASLTLMHKSTGSE
jgi:hypothetical protein